MNVSLELNGEELEFKMTNKTYLDLDERYGNAGSVINSVYYGRNAYDNLGNKPTNFGRDGFVNNSLKLISESCITRELSIDELEENLTSDQLVCLGNTAIEIYLNYMGVKESSTTDEEIDSKKK